jgi:hypothetical protein
MRIIYVMIKLQDLLNRETNEIYSRFGEIKADTIKTTLVDISECYFGMHSKRETKDLPDRIKEAIQDKYTKFYPMVKYIIRDGNVSVNANINNMNYDENTIDGVIKFGDDRVTHTFNLIKKALYYVKARGLPIPNTTLHIWISDRFPWYKNYADYIPIYICGKPANTNYLLFPDAAFECITKKQKYGNDCYDWDGSKKFIKEYVDHLTHKINKIYFKGVPTTRNNTNIRENLEWYSKKTNGAWLDIRLDAWSNYQSMEEFSQYKYLLNLPGHYPWSNRLRYLFLMKSLVINVDVKTVREGKYEDAPWVSLINYIVRPNIHYHNLVLTYYKIDKNDKEKRKELNLREFEKIKKQLSEIYHAKNKEKNEVMVKKGFDRVNKLKNKHIYMYIYNCILKNSKIKFPE